MGEKVKWSHPGMLKIFGFIPKKFWGADMETSLYIWRVIQGVKKISFWGLKVVGRDALFDSFAKQPGILTKKLQNPRKFHGLKSTKKVMKYSPYKIHENLMDYSPRKKL